MSRDIGWRPLKPGAPYGARHGTFIAGVALLELPSGGVTICGAMSCATRAEAERHAEAYRHDRRDLDHPMSRAAFVALAEQDC